MMESMLVEVGTIMTRNKVSIFWEDLCIADSVFIGSSKFEEAEIIEFAKKYDPQPFHIDPIKAKTSMYKSLIASGWHTCSVVMKIMCDSYLLNSSSQGASELTSLKWIKPIRAGDEIFVYRKALSWRKLNSRPNIGMIDMHISAFNQDKVLVLEFFPKTFFEVKGE